MSIGSRSPRVHSQNFASRDPKAVKPRHRPSGSAGWPAWTDSHHYGLGPKAPLADRVGRRSVPLVGPCS